MKLMDYLFWKDVDHDRLNFYKAMGLDCLLVHYPAEGAHWPDPAEEFKRLRRFVEAHGLELHVLHSAFLPREKIVHGLPGRDEQIETWKRILRAIGAAGVPNTAYTYQGIGHFRTPATVGRGNVLYSTFDMTEYSKNPQEHPDKAISADRLWENLSYFYDRIMPIAEEAGVRIALHPDDPPIPVPLGGADRIVSSLDQYERIFSLHNGRSNGMLFCQGCVAEMGENVPRAIRRIGEQDRIVFVHFRNIRGKTDNMDEYRFIEVFLDEGDVDMVEAMQVYHDIGYTGAIMMDHTPALQHPLGDWAGRAYANGYIRALIQAVYR
ncbi:MAG: mannonate dehydratase [candidate division Zixibacteria bacterium]|nr:mannonate dehydratase [candidate division Zixibacteria bacterium]